MELIVVRTEDVYPDENNPRTDFSGTEELAESFQLNKSRPGEPFQPPQLVRDGNIFRIYDGERRFRAMKHAGTESFTAEVYESYDEADAAIIALATNNKRQLNDAEESRGVQRVMTLGVDPVKVEKAAGLKRGTAAKIKSVMERAGQSAEQMSIDHMLAAYEFIDDDAAMRKLLKCSEGDYAHEAAKIRAKREREAMARELREKAEELGIELLEDAVATRTKGYSYSYKLTARSADDLEKSLQSCPGAIFGVSKDGTTVYGYKPVEGEPEKSAEEIELEKRAGELAGAFEAAFCDVREWFVASVATKNAKPIPNVMALVEDGFREKIGFDKLAERYPELAEGEPMSKIDLAVGFDEAFPFVAFSESKALKVLKRIEDWETRSVVDMADFFVCAEADGFEFSEGTTAAKEAFEAFMAGEDEE
ncbi:MAG: ParB N-terminal domain-containing protein [Eggerthellaceae bacterium]|nr:ParB N-terminal domain-containing protein [Eggerthellaceae bacterium]